MKLRHALIACLLLLASAACGVSPQPHPERLRHDGVPGNTSPPGPSERPTAPTRTLEIYLVQGDGLVAVRRQVPVRDVLREALLRLADGPAPAEAVRGIRSALPRNVRAVAAVMMQDRVAVVDMDPGFLELAGQEQVLAVAHIVYTLCGPGGATGVRVRVERRLLELPTGNSSLANRPLTRADFAPQAPATVSTRR